MVAEGYHQAAQSISVRQLVSGQRTKGTPVTFAAVGDVHGAMHAMVRLLEDWETTHRRHIDFVLQVGDFEPHRHHADLDSASIPKQYRHLGDFPDFAAGRARLDWPIYFIGGNHEPYGFLETMPNGGLAAPNCHYLGRVGRVQIGGLSIVGLTGIYSELGLAGRPPLHAMAHKKKKLYTYFSEEDIERVISFGRADVLVLHEWPRGAIAPQQEEGLRGMRRSSRPAEVGSDLARLVVDAFRPKLIVAGHMHWRHRSRIGDSAFAAMGHIDTGPDALGVFEVHDDGRIVEIVD
jgi:lariat debranching enzyme